MKYKILKKESNSTECFICGTENPGGVQASFYALETGECACVFTAKSMHEGHPGILHGGVICAILDETAGRAMSVKHPSTSAYTVELKVDFKKTIPSNVECVALGRIDRIEEKVYIASGEIYLPSGQKAASCEGTYYIISPDKVHESSTYHEAVAVEDDLTEIEIPDFVEPPKKRK